LDEVCLTQKLKPIHHEQIELITYIFAISRLDTSILKGNQLY